MKLHPSEEVVTVRLKELGETEDKPKYESQPDERKKDKKRSRDKERVDAAESLSEKVREQYLEDREPQGNGASERPWLAPHIKVKIIDKRKSQGK